MLAENSKKKRKLSLVLKRPRNSQQNLKMGSRRTNLWAYASFSTKNGTERGILRVISIP